MELAAAIRAGEIDTVRALVAADPALAAARDAQGLPVVLLALFHQRRDIADVLLEAEPELGVLEAAAVGRVDRLRELLPAGIDDRTPEGFSALGLAAFLGGPEAVRALLEHGADPNAAEFTHSQTALMWAAAQRHADVVAALVEHGADV